MFEMTLEDLELELENEENTKIITMCKALDDHLGGGIAAGLITELCGGSGSGKTQFCLQLCVNVQLPEEVGGLAGKALYLDTNQDFNPARLKEIAECMEERFEKTCQSLYLKSSGTKTFNVNSLLDNVLYSYCTSCEELMAKISTLNETLKIEPNLKLIVIDAYTLPMRFLEIEDKDSRDSIDYEILMDLHKLADEFKITIVITNELTVRSGDDDENWQIEPALSDLHTHLINQRIILTRNVKTNQRIAYIDKALVAKVGVPFVIKKGGIRGVS